MIVFYQKGLKTKSLIKCKFYQIFIVIYKIQLFIVLIYLIDMIYEYKVKSNERRNRV